MLELKSERLNLLPDKAGQPISICGKSLIADSLGAIYWPAEQTLLVADLHLEKASAYAGTGALLPPYDTRETLIRLAETIDRYAPRCVIALGDSFHDANAAQRIDAEDLERLDILQEGREWIWLNGNHDASIAASFGGRVAAVIKLAGITLRHQPAAGCAHMRSPATCIPPPGSRSMAPPFAAHASLVTSGGLSCRRSAHSPAASTC